MGAVEALYGLPEPVLEQAINWQVKLLSGTASRELFSACEQWRNAHPDHNRAWLALTQLDAQFTSVRRETPLVKQALVGAQQQLQLGRRQAVKMLLMGGALIPASVASLHYYQKAQPAYVAGVGEPSDFSLPDNSHFTLNSRSAVDVQMGSYATHIFLRDGDVYVDTRKQHEQDGTPRTTRVHANGWQLSLAAGEYVVRRREQHLAVRALSGEVVASHAQLGYQPLTEHLPGEWWLDAQQSNWQAYSDVQFDMASWLKGALVVKQIPLPRFLAELGRYRKGWLRTSPELVQVLVSGVFQTRDTDLALRALTQTLPLKASSFTPYFVSFSPA